MGADGRSAYRINSLGGRGPEVVVKKPVGALRVLCLGDSFTFGEGVREDDTWPAELGEALSKQSGGRAVQVINAGVQGYDTKDEAALYLLQYAAYKPDVVIMAFVLNDATESSETIRQNEALKKDSFSALGRISSMVGLVEQRRNSGKLQEEFFETTRKGFDSPKWAECKEVLAGMARVAKEDHFRFIVVIFPVFWQLDDQYPFKDIHQKIAAACREAGCECINLLDTYRGLDAPSLWVHPTDQHPNEIAHRLAAERIAEYLRGLSR
jgi:lysophospholipase L1-like esterase